MQSSVLLSQARQLVELAGNTKYKEITILSNISSLIFYNFDNLNWAGFYYIDNNRFVLGPFQGKVACTNIPTSKGMLGKCYKKNSTLIVDDVHKEKAHIACDSASNSELIIPIYKNGTIYLLLDIDSTLFSRFKEEDIKVLEDIAKIVQESI